MLTRIRLEYVLAWPNHAGLFVARHKGWYGEHGLDVDISWDGPDRGSPVDLVRAGEFQFAAVRLGELLETRRHEQPLVALATFNQRQLAGVISVKSSGISSFADLEGKRVMFPPVPRQIDMLREAMSVVGADFRKVELLSSHPFEPDVRSVERGHCDAVFSVLGWESYQGSTPFDEVVQLSYDDVGVTPHHAYFLCASEQLVSDQPELVHDFVAATARGYDFARDEPQAAMDIMGPTMCAVQPDALRASLDFMTPSWHGPSGRWGEIQEPLLRSYTQWMIDHAHTTATMDDIAGAWTNDFLP